MRNIISVTDRGRQAIVVLAIAVFVIISSVPVRAQSEEDQIADTVYRNGNIHTVDAFHSTAQAVAIKDGKFIAVGSEADIKKLTGKDTEVINLRGKMVLPGLVDTHLHAVRGALGQLFFCQFPTTDSIDQYIAKVKECVDKADKGAWVEGKTWDSAYQGQLTAAMLDKISPDNPVYLHDDTNHLSWVNTAALKAANITKDTLEPAGGHIGRDKDGNPTGVLYDSAQALIIKVMTPPTDEQLKQSAKWIFDKMSSYGVTGVITAQLDAGRLKAYRALEQEGQLKVRIQGSWDFNTRYATKPIDQMAADFATRKDRGPVSDLINPDGVKIYLDGVWIGYGSPFIDQYSDGSGNFGRQSIDLPTLSTWVTRFDKEGLKVMMHAVGDLAVRNGLNAVAAARRANGPGGPRHHLGHNTFVHAEDIATANELNVSREVSPANTWYPSSYSPGFVELLGDRVANMVPIGGMQDGGGHVTYGSDWDNVPEPDPWMAMQTLITRMNPEHPEQGVLGPQQRVDLLTALEIMTINGARAMELEDVTGSIMVGKDADMVVIDQNLFEIPADEIIKTRVSRTVLKGKTVYER
jgi:predicted amidohydrolase YtcJ